MNLFYFRINIDDLKFIIKRNESVIFNELKSALLYNIYYYLILFVTINIDIILKIKIIYICFNLYNF